MIELRPALNEAMQNIQRWRNVYSTNIYPHKIVLNMMYRAYSTRIVYIAYLNDELPEFEDLTEATNYILEFYGSAAVKEVHPYLENWITNKPDEEVGTICFLRYDKLANLAENDYEKREELEFSYIFELLNDMSVLYYIALRLIGQTQVEAFAKLSDVVIEKIPNMDYTVTKQVLQQLLVARYLQNNYTPLP